MLWDHDKKSYGNMKSQKSMHSSISVNRLRASRYVSRQLVMLHPASCTQRSKAFASHKYLADSIIGS